MAKVVSSDEIFHFMHGPLGGKDADNWIAGRQLGLITVEQLNVAGIGRGVIARRVAAGFLHRMFRGVYLVGNPIPLPGARELGAILACGRRTFISHGSAAGLWRVTAPQIVDVEVTAVGRNLRTRDNLRVHIVDELDPLDRRVVNGIPVTSAARTLIDLAAVAGIGELERAVNEARVQRLITDRDLRTALERAGRRSGTATLRRLLDHEAEPGFSRKEAERLVRRLIHDAGLPEPRCNARLEGREVDFLWPEQRLVVEVDGYRFHGHRSAFERDRKKDQLLTAAGYVVIRVTWLQLVHEPLRVAATIAAALTARRTPG